MKKVNWERTMANLRDALAAEKMPHNVFADRVGISPQQLSNYLACRYNPTVDVFMRMQEVVNFQTVWTWGR